MIIILLILVILSVAMYVPNSRLNRWLDNQDMYVQLALFVITFIPLSIISIYILDYYNIPSKFGIGGNLMPSSYIDHIITLLAASLGAFVLIVTTKIQIYNNQKQSNERMKEEKRINNIPIFSYKFERIKSSDDLSSLIKINNLEYFKDLVDYDLYRLTIDNVGLNAALKIRLSFSNKYKCYIGNYDKSCLGKEKNVSVLMAIPKYKEKTVLTLNINYFDLLNNEYKQSLVLSFEPNSLVYINDKLGGYYKCEPGDSKFIKPNKKEKKLTK